MFACKEPRCVLSCVFETPELFRPGSQVLRRYGIVVAYYLPKKDGEFIMPERIGHPDGLPDERNYLKILLAPFGLYRPLPWFKRVSAGPEPAE
jgi:hypothetical protein